MSYTFHWENDGYMVTLTGKSSVEEINEANGALQGDYRFDAHKYQIWNQLEADLSSVDIRGASEPASIDGVASSYRPKIKIALVTKEDNAIEFAKEYIVQSKIFNPTWVIQIFDNMDDATKWAQSY